MEPVVHLDAVYVPSEDVVAREIEGEIIIVPLVSGIADVEDELFTLNNAGRAIWNKLDGKRNLKELLEALSTEYEAPLDEIERDLIGFMKELIRRRIVHEYP